MGVNFTQKKNLKMPVNFDVEKKRMWKQAEIIN